MSDCGRNFYSGNALELTSNINQIKTTIDNCDVFEGLHLPVLVFDEAGKIAYANNFALDVLASSFKGLKTLNLFEIVRPLNVLNSLVHEVLSAGIDASASEIEIISPNLTSFSGDVLLTPHSTPNHVIALFWPRTTNNFKKQALANERNQSFGRIGLALAHEVKNPLAGIRGAAQLLMLDASDEQKPLGNLIIEETDRIHRLMDKVESLGDDASVKLKPVNIHAVLDTVVKLAENGFASDINITCQFDVSLPQIMGDTDSLIQIFLNLAKNAAEAARERGDAGQIIFATHYRHDHKMRKSERGFPHLPIEVAITDNGFGIAEELQNFLFDPFVTTKANGSGMGLAIIRKLIAAHSGIIEFDTENGRTVFKVRLPLANLDIGE